MKRLSSPSLATWSFVALVAGALLPSVRGAAASDISATEKRRVTVDTAAKLAKPSTAKALPEGLPLPFSPAGFDTAESQEHAVAVGKPAVGPKVSTDHDILEEIATKFPPTGTVMMGGQPLLIFGKKYVKIGTHFTVPLNGQDYDLELVNIDRTNFTLRLNREEITRPIKPAK